MAETARSPMARPWFLGLLAVNLLGRCLWILYMHPPQKADFDWYFTHAVQLAQHNVYEWNGHPTAYWPIGWPLFLSLFLRIFGPHMMVGMFVNAVLSTGIVALIYRLAAEIFSSHRMALCAAIGYSLLPSQILWNSVLGSEELFTFLLVFSMYLYVHATRQHTAKGGWIRPTLFAGLLLGLASDVRPITLLFPLVIFLYEWWINRRRWLNSLARVACFVGPMAAAIAPVTIRNILSLHHFVLVSTNGGTNLWQGTKTDSGYYWSWLPWKNPLLAAHNNELLQDQIGKKVAERYILSHPLTTLHHGILKIISLYKDDVNSVWYTFHVTAPALTTSISWFCTVVYGLFMLLAAIGLIRVFFVHRGAWRLALFPAAWIVYNTLLFMFFPAWDRFRYPMMPLFALFLGAGLALLWKAERDRPSAARPQGM
ncbi:hypothetical protein GCM10025857_24340 [Alicyclobacillus contaminans]|uniref:glycosyltransferase family 39 protein n=1 Tax=Alicyclobacillus contaminans TaxID=392016 RepID=UPI000424F17F|nr:glycosyltransferase family 39 protein [Alicyclobacillus contaminans]GMA51077.1 hypothetical protein GCM10025857_24340 [Alicyclobacillus contaminans]